MGASPEFFPMRSHLGLLPILLLFVPACADNSQPASVALSIQTQKLVSGEYKSGDGHYSVRFPKNPVISHRELATSAGVLNVETAKCESGRDPVYSVSFTTYPSAFGDVDAKTILDGVRDGLKGQDGELRIDQTIAQEDSQSVARDVRITAGKNTIRARLVMVDRRLVQVLAVGTKDSMDGKEVEAFFKSFEVEN
jgi:hypothetical protein